jgi:hypothetical protein
VDELGVTLAIEGEPSPTFASEKSETSTPFTDSLNVAVHCTEAAFVGVAPARASETTVGATESTDQMNDVAELALEPLTARTSNVCEPWASGPG